MLVGEAAQDRDPDAVQQRIAAGEYDDRAAVSERGELVDECRQLLGPRASPAADISGDKRQMAVSADEQLGAAHGLACLHREARPSVGPDPEDGDHAGDGLIDRGRAWMVCGAVGSTRSKRRSGRRSSSSSDRRAAGDHATAAAISRHAPGKVKGHREWISARTYMTQTRTLSREGGSRQANRVGVVPGLPRGALALRSRRGAACDHRRRRTRAPAADGATLTQ